MHAITPSEITSMFSLITLFSNQFLFIAPERYTTHTK